MGNNKRAIKAKEHHEYMVCSYKKDIEDSIKRSKVYKPDVCKNISQFMGKYEMEIKVVDLTTSEAIFEYGDGKNHLGVLNFASYRYAGGGYIIGSLAQEEALCHDSNLYEVLSSEYIQEEFYKKNLESLCNNLYTSRLVYSPDIVFVSDTVDVKCDVITCAAPNIGAYLSKHRELDNYKDILRDRVDNILYSAFENNVETLILGAFGCGVFKNNPYNVAEVFRELIFDKYSACFRKVIFAIPKGKNLDAFKEVFNI